MCVIVVMWMRGYRQTGDRQGCVVMFCNVDERTQTDRRQTGMGGHVDQSRDVTYTPGMTTKTQMFLSQVVNRWIR